MVKAGIVLLLLLAPGFADTSLWLWVVTATGLVYDFLLQRMAASLLSDPETAYPADLYPFPSHHDRARRYLALALLRTFKAFPEMLWRYPNPNGFPYWHHTFNQDALLDTAAVR